MLLAVLLKKTERLLRDNSPAILTALGVSGTITTAYLTGKATYKVARDEDADPWASNVERVKKYWQLYIPATVSGAVTIGCIVGATRVNSKRVAAAYSIISVTEKAFDEYKEKVIEKYGEKKEQAIRDEVAQDRITHNPPGKTLMVGSGKVACYEMFTGRYFESDYEGLRKAQNDINAAMLRHDYATLSDFYYLIGLEQTTDSSRIGWQSDKQMELVFSAVLNDGRPCVAFDYNYTKIL